MRQKTLKVVLTFATSSDAMAVEAAGRAQNFPGRMIPVPSEVSAGCGLAWCVPNAQREELLRALDGEGLHFEALHLVELY